MDRRISTLHHHQDTMDDEEAHKDQAMEMLEAQILVKQKQDEIKDWEEKWKGIKRKEQQMIEVIGDLQSYASSLELKSKSLKERIRKMRDQNQLLKDKVADQFEFHNSFKNDHKKMIERMTRRIEVLETEKREWSQAKSVFESEKGTILHQKNRLERQIDEEDEEREGLMEENERLHRICNDLRNLVESSSHIISKKEEEIETMKRHSPHGEGQEHHFVKELEQKDIIIHHLSQELAVATNLIDTFLQLNPQFNVPTTIK
eukprot:TRINITY_DN7339_c0_g1_i1.p1 TRINITY_DN7339_c0_g1~~TRINITY_DN7339_c0_g1_i1.p1  ORF type:complete len:260 (+),score=45.90 TRINITY_DN7339_c0_g1_i1:48-827(+)